MEKRLEQIMLIEAIERGLELYENAVIEAEHLAVLVKYVSRALGHHEIAQDVEKRPRRAVRHALRLIEMYFTPRAAPYVITLSIEDILKMLKEYQEEES